MDKEIISTNRIKNFLTDNIENFTGFANQVIHDDDFLKCVRELLPFDGVAYASMNVVPEKTGSKKDGDNGYADGPESGYILLGSHNSNKQRNW